VETRGDLHPQINPHADVNGPPPREAVPMTTFDYILDSALVLLVLLQIKERRLTTRTIIRPLVIVAVAVVNYLNGIPTGGNDLVLVAVLGCLGALIGVASGQTLIMRRGADGSVLARAGWGSAFFWVLGMGSRFAFIYWYSHSGGSAIADFSAHHSITSAEAWTVALLAMAVFEVLGRSLVMVVRRAHLGGGSGAAAELA
jgi:hypothetical protein